MPYREANRYLYLTTPLGEDKLLLRSFTGQEKISKLFTFQLSLWAENATVVDFSKLVGDKVSFGIEGASPPARHMHGIVTDFAQGDRGAEFTDYQMTVAPDVWKLTHKFGSRIFQHINVPDILKKVFTGFNVAYEIQGTFQPREYCSQYQESDFAFASRLMEEEGLYYYFKFVRGAHKLVISNASQHPPIAGDTKILYEPIGGGIENDERIYSWRKVQSWGSGQYTLWDHHFQLPHKKLAADRPVIESVTAGKVQHKLQIGGNKALEIYENPGRYAQRFDGIDKGGGEKPADLQKLFDDNQRTVRMRAEEIEVPMLLIYGQANHRQLTPGHKFTLQRHFNADDDYMVLEVSHTALEGGFRSDGEGDGVDHYENTFACLPDAIAYRTPRTTHAPVVSGPISAVVVGPPGEEIFTDKYGRVKVQFHWDREGKMDADSSCWLRVLTPWAGRNWGMVQVPRIGQEVIVEFVEGDADRPIIVGSVYNADQMPPFALPANKMVSGWKSNTTPGGGGFNELSMNDTKSKELVFIHAQKDMTTVVEHDDTQTIHHNRAIKVDGTHNETITKDTNVTIEQGPYKLDVQANTHTHHVKKDVIEDYDLNQQTRVAQNILTQSINAKITIDAKTEILLHCGDSMMSLKQDGTIVISGKDISILGSSTVKAGVGNQNVVCDVQKVTTSGAAINSNAVGMHTITGAVVKIN